MPPWTIRIDLALPRKMRIWGGHYPGLLPALQQRIQTGLASDPDAHLGGIIAPTMTRSCHLLFTVADGVPETLHITLYVNRHDDQRELHLVAGRLATERLAN